MIFRTTLVWTINAFTRTGYSGLHWCELSMPSLGHDPQPVYQNRERLLSLSKQYRVTMSTIAFLIYTLQVKVNRSNYNSYVMILNLFIKAGNDYSLSVNSTELLYHLLNFWFTCYKLKLWYLGTTKTCNKLVSKIYT